MCPICKGRKHIFKEGVGWTKCECFYEDRAKRLLKNGNFPITLQNLELSSFELNTTNKKKIGLAIKKQVEKWVDGKVYFIYSTTLEKEKAATFLVKAFLKVKGNYENVLMTSLDELTDAKFDKESELNFEASKADILVLQIGDEITNAAHINILYSVLKDRKLQDKVTILVSSVTQDKARQIYKEKVANFISTYAEVFII